MIMMMNCCWTLYRVSDHLYSVFGNNSFGIRRNHRTELVPNQYKINVMYTTLYVPLYRYMTIVQCHVVHTCTTQKVYQPQVLQRVNRAKKCYSCTHGPVGQEYPGMSQIASIDSFWLRNAAAAPTTPSELGDRVFGQENLPIVGLQHHFKARTYLH